MKRHLLVVAALSVAFVVAGCRFFLGPAADKKATAAAGAPQTLDIHSFSETAAVTTVQPVGRTLWAGSPRGLVRWDLDKQTAKKFTVADGLPSDNILALAGDGQGGVWVMTKAGLLHENRDPKKKGAWEPAPTSPLNAAFVTGLVLTSDGLWLGGPDGLARLSGAKWSRFLGTTQVTAVASAGKDVWVGTAGRGLLRVVGEQVEVYGIDQGCETETVRGMVATPSGVMAVGEGPGGQRISFFDGARFWSYTVDVPKGTVFEWMRRAGDHVLIGVGSMIYSIERLAAEEAAPPSAFKLTPVAGRAMKLPLIGGARRDLPEALPEAPPAPKPAAAPAPAVGTATTTPAPPPGKDGKPAPAVAPPAPPAPAPIVEGAAPAPLWTVAKWGPPLPEGVTCAGTDGATLAIGTRFLGVAVVDEKEVTALRTFDLAAGAERLSVACVSDADCYVATGTERAWHYDGQSFGPANIDPEKGSRVLAVLSTPRGGVMAIHRGTDRFLRLSQVSSDGVWTPIGATQLEVPSGVPDITFAQYAPTGRLWLGLRYVDTDGDAVDFGAAEVDEGRGDIVYHRKGKELGPKSKALPNDLESVHFVSASEAWFGARSGAVHLKDGQLRVYTENDGLESEIIHDITEGTDGRIWVATSRGVGRFDGTRWTFPAEGEKMRVKASSLARDSAGAVFVGAMSPSVNGQGLLVCVADTVDQVDTTRGLLDNKVLDLATDRRGRVWVLTEKGISVLQREISPAERKAAK